MGVTSVSSERSLGEFTHPGLWGRLPLMQETRAGTMLTSGVKGLKASEGLGRPALASLGLLYLFPRKRVLHSGVVAQGELLWGHHDPLERHSSCHGCSQACGGNSVLGDCRSAERGLADTTVLRTLASLCWLTVAGPRGLSWLFLSLVEWSGVGPRTLPVMLWG